MRALLCRAWGEIESLVFEDRPSPKPGAGQVRLRVHAAGVNFADTLMIAGKYQDKPPFPFSPGLEAAGEIVEIGSDAPGLAVGDRVMAILDHGGFAEEVLARCEDVFPIPSRLDSASAAGFPIVYGASHIALWKQANMQRGETLLVLGAAGGVGLTAVEIGKLMGARVIAAAGDAEKLAVAQSRGADVLIDYKKESIIDRVKEATNGLGADVVYDPVGGDAFDQSLRCLNWGARLLIVGFASGKTPQIPANRLFIKNASAMGVYWGSYRGRQPETFAESFRRLFEWVENGQLNPLISHQVPFDQAPEALRLLRDRKASGKVVVTFPLS
ncbi:NADPH:quinone reductase [Azospirillaceae bacterium]